MVVVDLREVVDNVPMVLAPNRLAVESLAIGLVPVWPQHQQVMPLPPLRLLLPLRLPTAWDTSIDRKCFVHTIVHPMKKWHRQLVNTVN